MYLPLGMNIRPTQQLPNQKVAQDQLQVPGPFEQQGIMGTVPEATLHAAAQVVENVVQNQQVAPLFPGGPAQGPPKKAQHHQVAPLFPGGPAQGPPNVASPWTAVTGMPVVQQREQQNAPQSDDDKKHTVNCVADNV